MKLIFRILPILFVFPLAHAGDPPYTYRSSVGIGKQVYFDEYTPCKDVNGVPYHEPYDDVPKWISPPAKPPTVNLWTRPVPLITNEIAHHWFDTTVDTPAGEYKIYWLTANSEHCNNWYWNWIVTVKPEISARETDIWWFNGENPSGYPTETVLTATGKQGPYRWRITKGASDAEFSGGGQEVTTTVPTVTIKALATASARRSVEVVVQENNIDSSPLALTVKSPHAVSKLPSNHLPHPSRGYASWIYYKVFDQFGDVLPGKLPCNEKFTGPIKNDYPNATWTRTPPQGSEACGVSDAEPMSDRILGQLSDANEVPISQNPQTPLGKVPVHHFPGEWRFGSSAVGKGVVVMTNRWQRFQDHAEHTNVISPVTQEAQ